MSTQRNRYQFQDLFSDVFVSTATLDLADAATGSGTGSSGTVTIPGVALGDIVLGLSASITLNTGGTTVNDATALTAYVSAANTVTVVLLNNDGAANNLASCTMRIVVARLSSQIGYL